jgi:Mg2+-importing ATPase
MSFLPAIKIPIRPAGSGRNSAVQISQKLVESARAEVASVLSQLNTTPNGLNQVEVEARLEKYGPNEVAKEKRRTWLMRLWENIKNPLVILLGVLGIISYLTGDIRATIMIFLMVILGIVLRYVQESRADTAAEKLKAMVSTTTSVLRDGKRQEIPLSDLVPGDMVTFSAGDMIPADLRVVTAKDLFINQAALTGESFPVEKTPEPARNAQHLFPRFQHRKRHRHGRRRPDR